MNWLFKQDNVQNDSRIIFSQKRSFTAKKNEKIITVKNIRGEWFFSNLYQIENLTVKTSDNINLIEINLKKIEEFQEEKPIESYLYSLRRITNFNNPLRHFNRLYNKLEDVELRAIVKDEIFYERTYFGVIVNSLPLEHRKSFLEFLSVKNISLLLSNPDAKEAFFLLKKYLEEYIIKPAKILIATQPLLNDLIESEYMSQIGFKDEKSESRNLIIPQIEMLDENLSEYENLLQDINGEITGQTRSFKNLFKNSKLPIQL